MRVQNGEDIIGGEDTYLHQDSISSPNYTQNHVQNPKGEDSEDGEDICDTEGVGGGHAGSAQVQGYSNGSMFKCYHPGCGYHTDSEEEYLRHGGQKHVENPLLYPSRYEIEKYRLTPQGKDWDV
jgi:hypothetical protein